MSLNKTAAITSLIATALLIGAIGGCDKTETKPTASSGTSQGSKFLAGQILIDGSSTVYPITDLAAKNFKRVQPNVWVKVDLSGSGRGLSRLLSDEIDIADASRCIKSKEIDKAAQLGINFIELPVAFDGIAVVVNAENDWVDYLTVAELKQIWHPDSAAKYWSDIRPAWPEIEIKPCAPTKESGTFDFFTSKICGKGGLIRENYFAHEDEHVLGPYVAEHKGSIGFFGYGWYQKYSNRLRDVPVANGDAAAVAPNGLTIADGTYKPLSRPLFIYINAERAKRPEVEAFVNYYIENITDLVAQADYFPLEKDIYKLVAKRFDNCVTGSAFINAVQGTSVAKLLTADHGNQASVNMYNTK